MNVNMQFSFWDQINSVVEKGAKIYKERNYKGLGLDRGIIEDDKVSCKAWFGSCSEGQAKILIKMNGSSIETEVLLGFSQEECNLLISYYQNQRVAVEIIGSTCSSFVRNKNSSVFVQSCEVYRESFNKTNQLIAILDRELHLRYANKALLNYLGVTMNDIIGTAYWELSLWSHSTELQNKILFSLEQMHLGNDVRFETTHRDMEGNLRDIDFVIKPIMDINNEVERLIAMGYDITESKLAESALKRTEKEMKLFFDYSVDGYYINRLAESIYLDPETLSDVFGYVQRHEKIISYNNAILQHIDIPATTFENTDVFDLLHISREKSMELWKEMVEQGYVKYQADIEVAGVRKILECTFVPILEEGSFTRKKDGVFSN